MTIQYDPPEQRYNKHFLRFTVPFLSLLPFVFIIGVAFLADFKVYHPPFTLTLAFGFILYFTYQITVEVWSFTAPNSRDGKITFEENDHFSFIDGKKEMQQALFDLGFKQLGIVKHRDIDKNIFTETYVHINKHRNILGFVGEIPAGYQSIATVSFRVYMERGIINTTYPGYSQTDLGNAYIADTLKSPTVAYKNLVQQVKNRRSRLGNPIKIKSLQHFVELDKKGYALLYALDWRSYLKSLPTRVAFNTLIAIMPITFVTPLGPDATTELGFATYPIAVQVLLVASVVLSLILTFLLNNMVFLATMVALTLLITNAPLPYKLFMGSAYFIILAFYLARWRPLILRYIYKPSEIATTLFKTLSNR